MIEQLLTITIFGYVTWWIIISIAIILIFVVSDLSENGYVATFFLVVYVAIFYIWGNVGDSKILSIFTISNLSIYLGIGFIYALIKSYLFGYKQGNLINDKYNKDYHFTTEHKEETKDLIIRDKKDLIEDRYNKIRDNVFRWWLMLPINLLTNGLNLISDAFIILWKYIGKIFKTMVILGINGTKQ